MPDDLIVELAKAIQQARDSGDPELQAAAEEAQRKLDAVLAYRRAVEVSLADSRERHLTPA
jgi:predicted DNA-binding transcriptional regulator YafY